MDRVDDSRLSSNFDWFSQAHACCSANMHKTRAAEKKSQCGSTHIAHVCFENINCEVILKISATINCTLTQVLLLKEASVGYSSHFLTCEEQKVRVDGRMRGREKRSVVVVCPSRSSEMEFFCPSLLFLRAWV